MGACRRRGTGRGLRGRPGSVSVILNLEARDDHEFDHGAVANDHAVGHADLLAREERDDWLEQQRTFYQRVIAGDSDQAEPALRLLAEEGRSFFPTQRRLAGCSSSQASSLGKSAGGRHRCGQQGPLRGISCPTHQSRHVRMVPGWMARHALRWRPRATSTGSFGSWISGRHVQACVARAKSLAPAPAHIYACSPCLPGLLVRRDMVRQSRG